MRSRAYSVKKLDVESFARAGAELAGDCPPASLARLADCAAPEMPAARWPAVSWRLTGERREPRGRTAQTWLHLEATATVWLTCQRCLQPVQDEFALQRWFQFVDNEAQAASLDAESEDDVLALVRSLDALTLIEDELLLALPLVPRHDTCPEPLVIAASAPAELTAPEPVKPLAGLAGLAALAARKRSSSRE